MQRALIMAAASLISDDGVNMEYDRGIIELVGTILGLDLSDDYSRELVLTMLRAVA